jgi:uncharacterized membrane protein YhhN
MEEFLNKRILTIYWIVLLVHCVFQYFELTYRAVTKPMLVPLLLTFLLLKDGNIGKPFGKAVFYIGMFLAFFGDILLILINDTFFLSGMIAFMLMNILYSISFLYITRLNIRKIFPFLLSLIVLSFIAIAIFRALSTEMGEYSVPVLIYMCTVSLMIACSVNIATDPKHRETAFNFLIAGALVFLVENILLAFNRFHWDSNKDVYIAVMITYGTAQYLIVKGISKVYP